MQSIPIGATGSFSLVVMPEHLASRFKDVTLPPTGENEEIGVGTHERVVLQLSKLSERMKAKFG